MKLEDLTEGLAALEHEQWMEWSKTVYNKIAEAHRNGKSLDDVAADLVNSWYPNWIPYNELDENTKELDRIYSNKIVKFLFDKGWIRVRTTRTEDSLNH